MNEQKIASSQRPGGSKGLHLPARTVSSCFPNRYKSLLRWDPDKIALQDLFCAGYMLCEMVVREEETQVFTWRTNPCAVTKFVFHSLNAQIAGIVSITDASGFGFKHLRAIGLEDGKNMVKFNVVLQNSFQTKNIYMKLQLLRIFSLKASFFNVSFPLYMRQTHVLHAPRFFYDRKKHINQPPFLDWVPTFQGFQHGVQYVEAIPDARG